MQRTPTSLATSLGFGGFHSNSSRDAAAPTTSTSHVPASLGIGSSQASSRSLSERLKLSRNASSSSSTPRSSSHADGLHFANAIPQGRNAGEFGSFPSIPSWGPQGSQASNGLPTSSSTGSLGSASAPTSSRNFLVPIGATGARQKLSISNASQRRKLNLSEDAKRSTDSPINASYDNGLGLNRSSTSLQNIADLNGASKPSLLRSSSVDVLAPASGSAAPESSHQASRSTLTPAELVQQAAMQRLSSQRIMPAPKVRSASDNFVPARSSSNRPSPLPSAAPTPTAERDQPSYSVPSPSPATEKRADPVPLPPRSASAATRSIAVTTPAPEPSVSSLRSDPRKEISAAPALANAIPRQPQVQPPAEESSIPPKPLTLAETYKRAMLERDAERAKVAARSAGAVSSKPASSPNPASAPTLDLNLPSSSFLFDDDTAKANESSATHTPAPPITSYTYSNASPRVQDRSEQRTDGRSQLSTTPTQDASSRRIAALSSATTPQRGTEQPSLQKSYDDAMAIQHRIRSGPNDEPAYGGLFDSNVDPFAKQVKDKDTARSYLALRDEDEDAAAAPSKQATVVPAPSSRKVKEVVASVPTPVSDTPRTPPADKSFVQLTTPEQERSKQSIESPLPSQDLASSFQGVQQSPRVAQLSDVTRPAIPRETSLKTLRSPPNKLESSPGPREEAALQAGAIAAATTSPILSSSETSANASANASKPSSRASPAVNGEQEVAEVAKWRRSQEALATFSPLQQSRFSEASTDFSDSRAPTRNENRYSGRASSISSNDGLEEESGDGQLLPASAWHEVENALRRFRDKATVAAADRGNLLRAILLPFLALEAETATVDVIGNGPYVKGKARRALFFDWIRSLLLELQHVQTSADRGAILESIACIIESRNFSASILGADPEDEARFSSVFGHILSYAIGELNKKGVYQNTLIFSGRLLAVAFFRVNGVASKLLRALPVNRFALERVAREFEWQRKRPHDFERFANRFPATLRQLCYKDSRDYLKMLDSETVAGSANGLDSHGTEDDRFLVCQPEVEVEMSGNWLRRWQSDDSELFFSFCRSYHRQLASLFASSKSLESVSKYFFGGPGYAHLATCIHQKCLALVHRVILSVTTLSSQKNFNPAGETANVLSGSTAGKPRILEAANRRCTAIVVDIVRAPAGTNMIFAPMLGLHIKALIKRTSLYDVQGVFCLLDWLDGVISHMDSNDLIGEGLIDVSFIITTIGMLLENADHALALMRTIAFCYANFGVLTATSENRIFFCEQILLKPSVFHKLFLSWSFTIRAYYLHLLVFRLARIRDFPSPKDDPSGRSAVRVVRLFSQRLELLRRRHDLLSPEIDSSSDGTKSEDGKSRKSGTSTFVSTIKRASTDGGASSEGSVEGRPKAEKIMGMTAVDPSISPAAAKSGGGEGKKSSHSKTKSWLKAFRSSSKQDIKNGGGNSPRAVQAFSPTTGKVTSATESDDDSKTIGSSRTTPRTSFESASSDNMSDVSTLAGSIRGGKTSKSSSAFEFDIKQQQQQQQSQQQSQGNGSNAHDAGIAKDTVFDLQSTHAQHLPTPGRTPQSPRISRAFSRRASMLPGPASELVAGTEGEDEELPPMPDLPAEHFGLGLSGMNGNTSSAEVYPETLHIYAVQSLREYEQTVQEHDEFFASLPAEQSTQVPRLPVNWPAMWSSNGE